MVMKKAVVFVLVLLGILPLLLCCGKQEVMRLGVNAEILEVDDHSKTLKVCFSDDKKLTFFVDCNAAAEGYQILYADYETGMTQDISFASLQAGDAIALSMMEETYQNLKRGATVQALSVQLLTQRLPAENTEAEGGRVVKMGNSYDFFPTNP